VITQAGQEEWLPPPRVVAFVLAIHGSPGLRA
jgi:hypothetical protein